MEGFLSPVVRDLPPSGIRKFFDLAMTMKGVISLGVGEPDFMTPWHVREACVDALQQGYTMYTSNRGLPELCNEISAYLLRKFNLEYNPEKEILVTVGASEAIDLAMRSLVVPGDEVLIPEPCYVSYKPCVLLAGGKPVPIPTTASRGFKLTSRQLERYLTPKSKLLVLSYPNNPTGTIMKKDELEEIAQVVRNSNLLVIADEIYGELTYTGTHCSFASLPEMQSRTILINGVSKAYAMTGWRIGYVAANTVFINGMLKIHQYTILCAPIMNQISALEALKYGGKEVKRMRRQYDQRRMLTVSRLRDMGMECFLPEGAFYVFPSIERTGLTSLEFAEGLLREEKVAVVPGDAFGQSGSGHIRCSYAASIPQLTEALDRMERFVNRCFAKGSLQQGVR